MYKFIIQFCQVMCDQKFTEPCTLAGVFNFKSYNLTSSTKYICELTLSKTSCFTSCKIQTIDDFRGACAVKGNVQVAGHVKRVDHGDASNALRYVKKR